MESLLFKIIGFYLSPSICFDNNKGIGFGSDKVKCRVYEVNEFKIKIWYIGLSPSSIPDVLSMSPYNNYDLLDRNLLININKDTVIIQNDWLGSIPVFFNKRTKEVSTYFNLVFNKKNVNFDIDALLNYFEAGFCLYGKTQFPDIEFLRFYSKLILNKERILVEEKRDVLFDVDLCKSEPPLIVFKKIKSYINEKVEIFNRKVLIPTSGGYDSRLLNLSIENKKLIHSYSYGLSNLQQNSYEVVYAKCIAQILKTKSEVVILEDINSYINEWHKIFGSSTHLHGMYQMEFYDKITKSVNPSNFTLLSGIIGDAWSGKVRFEKVENYKYLNKIAYSHGMNLNTKYYNNNLNKINRKIYDEYIETINHDRYQLVFRMRNKLILLNYLLSIPEHFGITSWTPFLNFEIVMSMLNISDEHRINRNWQTKIFQENNLNIEKMNLSCSFSNNLNLNAALNFKFDELKLTELEEIVGKKNIDKINFEISKKRNENISIIINKLRIYKILEKIFPYRCGHLNYLYDYYTLKSIDLTLLNYE